jgi:hypothetical protein
MPDALTATRSAAPFPVTSAKQVSTDPFHGPDVQSDGSISGWTSEAEATRAEDWVSVVSAAVPMCTERWQPRLSPEALCCASHDVAFANGKSAAAGTHRRAERERKRRRRARQGHPPRPRSHSRHGLGVAARRRSAHRRRARSCAARRRGALQRRDCRSSNVVATHGGQPARGRLPQARR